MIKHGDKVFMLKFMQILLPFSIFMLVSCESHIQILLSDKTSGAQRQIPLPLMIIEGGGDDLNLNFSKKDLSYVRNSRFSFVEDFNDDGFLDIVVSRGFNSSSIQNTYVYSGRDGSLMYLLSDNDSDSGWSAEHFIVNDLNGDGIGDIVVVAQFSYLNAYSGIDGSLIWTSPTDVLHSPRLFQVEDINSDGVQDIIVYNILASSDDYILVSGLDGSMVWSQNYSASGKVINASMPDHDSDGLRDLLVSELKDGPYILSSATGAVISGCPGLDSGINPTGSDDYILGDDYDGDGLSDYIRFHYDARSAPAVFSSADCSLVYNIGINGMLESSENLIGDINSDGVKDFFINDPTSDMDRGSVSLVSGFNGDVLSTITGPAQGAELVFKAKIDDIDNDGFKDFYVTYNTELLREVVTFYSGASFSPLFTFQSESSAGNAFYVELVDHDLNGDGINDIAISDAEYDNNRGKVYFYSGSDGSLLNTLVGENADDQLAGVILSDKDNDGKIELNISASGYNNNRGKMYSYNLIELFD